ncbi:MAG TPA: BON domain-containing protein [Xanthobacteraceae bacterium]|nr:BON domain-containing protein [Xanthobacteraceae bacterium]
MDDKELRARIVNELEFEPSVDATHIGVTVEKGIVTLTGHVSTYAEKLAAEAAVRRIAGVRGLAEEIEIRFPADKKTADDEIAKRALDIIDWDVTVPDGAVQVKVERGWVTLTGAVEWQYQRKAAEEDVRRLTGVKGVVNQVVLKPSVSAADLQHRIEDALRRRADVEAKGIRISVDGGKVVLEGKVQNLDEREAVERAAWSAPGVQSVDDRLTVS